MKRFLTFVAILSFSCGFGQNINFIKSYGGTGFDYGKDIKQALDTGYIVTGSSSSFTSNSADAYLLKVDSLGNFEWSYNYGGSETEWGESLTLTLDSGYAIGGYTNSYGSGGFDFYLVKTAIDGTPEFEKTYGGSDWDRAFGIAQASDSGYVLVGETFSYGNGNSDIYIVRTDKNGDTLWTRTYGGSEDDFANDVIIDGDSVVIAGGTESFGAGMLDGIIMKYHIDGTLGWIKYVGMERDDYFNSIVSNGSGEYFAGGSRLYYYDQTGYLNDFWIYNITSDGQTVIADTSMTGGSHEVEVAYDLIVDPIDNMFYGGSTKSFGYSTIDGNTDAFIGRLDNNYYQASYVNNFGVAGNDVIYGMDYCYDLGIVAVGQLAYGSEGGASMIIVRVDKNNSAGNITVLSELTFDEITLSYESIIDQPELNVYPTLVSNELNIQGLPPNNKYQIYSNTGQLVIFGENCEGVIYMGELQQGLYILKVQTDQGVFTQKLIKQ